jgi:site-specific DNA-methyltransferase (adenine-specific)
VPSKEMDVRKHGIRKIKPRGMKTEKVKISEIHANKNNPRIIKDDKFRKLVKSIQDFPQMLEIRPIVVDEDNIVLGGNMRLKACKEAGLKEVYIVKADNLTEEQKQEFIVKDNVGFGEWDWDSLANEWDVEKLEEWGLDLPVDLSVTEIEAEEDDFDVPEGGIETDIVLGDLFEIGEHRLLCGDSTDSDSVAKLMNGEKADMVFTDPPYGVSASGGRSQTVERDNITKIVNDNLRGNELKQFISDAISIIPIKESGSFYICYDQKTQVEFISAIKENNWNFKRTLIWNKNVFGLSGKKGYRPKYELIAFGCIGEEYNWFGDNAQADVIDVARPKEREGNHPTPKPIELIAITLKNSSEIGNLIMDSFIGSGSTMVASHQLKRKCYGMELDPKYCQVIIDRMKKLDPSLVIKRNGEII